MIDLYTWPTPNGRKVHIFLEETGLPYNVHAIEIGKGDQFKPDFLKISPNNKMPALLDRDGPGGKPISVFESGAILIYLADKTSRFLPREPHKYYDVLQWLMWQMGGFGPMLGQAHHFLHYAPEKIEYAMSRYRNEANRLYRVLNTQLTGREWVAAGEYTIADMAIFPWSIAPERQDVNIDDYPNVKRWRAAMNARPAVKRALDVLADRRRQGDYTPEQRDILFGATQYARR